MGLGKMLDGWRVGGIDGWMDGCMGGCMGGCMDRWVGD